MKHSLFASVALTGLSLSLVACGGTSAPHAALLTHGTEHQAPLCRTDFDLYLQK